MKRYNLAVTVVFVLLSLIGCDGGNLTAGTPEPAGEDEYVEPIEAAFAGEDLGEPLDWKSLGQADRDFIGALYEKDTKGAKEALAAGAHANLNCGYRLTSLMLAAATGDGELVAAVKAAGGAETPEAEPYMEVMQFAERSRQPAFQQALAEVEKLSKRKPVPADGPGAYRIELGAEAARDFLERHHASLLDKGCFVFLREQNFGFDDRPDVLNILPTKNKFAVMAFTGVNGINYDIDNHLVIRWMKRLDEDQPYFLTGCGLDFLSGRFREKVPDPKAMAKKMYEFCPDIVWQGTGTVAALEDELRETNELYFWWD